MTPSRQRVASVLLAGMSALVVAGAGGVAGAIDVIQKHRAFVVGELMIERGSSLRFINEDDFPHQVHVTGPDMDTDSPLQSSGTALVVAFPVKGTFEVTCGVHPRMHMTVIVK